MAPNKGLLLMRNKNKETEEATPQQSIVLGIMVDGVIIEKFAVGTPRLAALFLSNPTFVELND